MGRCRNNNCDFFKFTTFRDDTRLNRFPERIALVKNKQAKFLNLSKIIIRYKLIRINIAHTKAKFLDGT